MNRDVAVNVGIAHKTRKGTTDICHEGKRELLGIGGCKWALNGKKTKSERKKNTYRLCLGIQRNRLKNRFPFAFF